MPLGDLGGGVGDIASSGFIGAQELQGLVISALAEVVEETSADHLLSQRDEARVAEICTACDLSFNDLGPTAQRLLKAQVLRGLQSGKLVKIDITSDVRLQPGDYPVWEFNHAHYLTIHSHVKYVGRSHGVSIRDPVWRLLPNQCVSRRAG